MIQKLICHKDQRLTAVEALKHPFVTGDSPSILYKDYENKEKEESDRIHREILSQNIYEFNKFLLFKIFELVMFY